MPIKLSVETPSTEKPLAVSRVVTEFAKRVKSALWRQDTGKERPKYDAWVKKVVELESSEGAGYTHAQAIVQASKDYTCLFRLFREYDLSAFDPNPDSHPQIRKFGESKSKDISEVICEGKKQPYRQSLNWALDNAGTYLRTGVEPVTCPNDIAWYLYEQAKAEPKDFLGKVNQVEMRGDSESEDVRNAKKSGRRSIAEIDMMLSELESEDDRDDNSL